MSLWKLEWIRLFRTKRWIALLGVYVFFGLVGPLTARYISEILESFGGGVQVVVPEPVAADGIASYVSNAAQIGLLVAIGVAAAALTFDAKPQMGIFLRTRVNHVRDIVGPRYLVVTAAVATAFTLGSIAALYESTVLMGSLPFGGWLLGTLLGCLYLAFAVAVVAAVAGKTESVLVTVIVAIGVLLLMPIIGIAPEVGEWMPSHLVGAIDSLVRGGAVSDYLGATVVTVALTVGALGLAVRWAEQREL
jgi:ABC-2 type transport system permease protein